MDGVERAHTAANITVPCVRCGYELRGLPGSALCPECSYPRWQSVQGNRLASADPDYLARLHWGAVVALVGVLGRLLFVAGAIEHYQSDAWIAAAAFVALSSAAG